MPTPLVRATRKSGSLREPPAFFESDPEEHYVELALENLTRSWSLEPQVKSVVGLQN